MTTTTRFDVIVVGGGLAGLTAGATASRAGASVLVLEARRPGGRSRTVERDGFVLNMGGHALYAGGEGMRVLRGLGVEPKGTRPPLRGYKLLVDGEMHVMPAGPGSMMRTTALSVRSKAALGKLLGLLPRVDASRHAGETVDDWLATHSLRADAEGVARALIRTATYTDQFDALSAEAAISQMQYAVSSGVLYLDGGWQPMIDGLSDLVDVRSGAVRSVVGDGGSVVVTMDDASEVVGRTAIVAVGTPASARAVLAEPPDWGDLGEPVVAACLDLGVRGIPDPGYVIGVDEPVFATTQSPPARQAPIGDSVMAVLRYGTTDAINDRAQTEKYARLAGVRREAIAVDRFLARMVVTGAMPLAANGGFRGRPTVSATGSPRVFIAGDWVGDRGLLADASFASGHSAALAAVQTAQRSATMVG